MQTPEHPAATLCEYQGQLVTGYVVRRFLFMQRVRLTTEYGYFFRWIPAWRCSNA